MQEHTTAPGEVHFDLMIEDGEVLVTYQLLAAPGAALAAPDAALAATPSFDHRRRYLEFEGELSDGRGRVRIVDRGRVRDLRGTPRDAGYLGEFTGEVLRGQVALGRDGDGLSLRRVGA